MIAFEKIFSNGLSNVLQYGSRWLLNLVMARGLPTSAFGSFSFAYSVAAILSVFFAFGSNLYLISSKETLEELRIKQLVSSIVLSFALFLITIALVGLLCSIGGYPINHLLSVALAFVWAVAISLFSFHKGLGNFKVEAQVYSLTSILLVICLMVGTMFEWFEDLNIVLLFLIVIGLVPIWLGVRRLDRGLFCWMSLLSAIELPRLSSMIRKRASFGIHEFLSVVYFNIPVVMLGILAPASVLGEFRSVNILLIPVLAIPVFVSQVLLNQLSSGIQNGKDFTVIFRKYLILTAFVGAAVSIGYFLFAPELLRVFYGERLVLQEMVEILRVFSISTFFWFLKSNYEVALTALGEQWLRVKTLWLIVPTTALLFSVFWYKYLLLGAALAWAISNIVLFLIYLLAGELLMARNSSAAIEGGGNG